MDAAVGTVTLDLTAGTTPGSLRSLAQRIATLPAAAAAAHESTPQRLTVALRTVPYSHNTLAAAMSQIPTRQPWAGLARPYLTSWGVDPRTDTVEVGLTRITPQLQTAAHAAFGDRVSLVRQQPFTFATRVTMLKPGYHVVDVAPRRTTSLSGVAGSGPQAVTPNVAPSPSRLLDSSPYWGGDRIYRLINTSSGTVVDQCTGGFMWSPAAMSTAGHCGPTGTVWSQGYLDTSANTLYSTGTMGTVYVEEFGNGRIDSELMNNSAWQPYVYTALQGASPVSGYETSVPGQTVCTDGSFSGENCTAQVVEVNICLTVQGVNVCGIDTAASTNSTTLCQPGDSGGPVYTYSGNSLLADGLISICNGTGTIVGYAGILESLIVLGGTIATP